MGTIRSFVHRRARLTEAQRRGLDTEWEQFGAEPLAVSDLAGLFTREAPCTLEIGFGMGDSLLALAAARPHWNVLGVEVYPPGVGRVLTAAAKMALPNLRVVMADIVLVLQHMGDSCLDEVLIFFPDPWPKRRHHKRRLVQTEFLDELARVMRVGARLELATDWQPYAEHMLATLEAHPRFFNALAPGVYSPRSQARTQTKFERRGNKLGHKIKELAYFRQ